jgi:protein-arginine kinase activator protein McsA
MFGRNFDKLFNEFINSDPFFYGGNNWKRKEYKSEDGSISFTYITNRGDVLDKSDELSLLKQKLEIAVDEQKFEDAVIIRDKIKRLEENKEELNSLNKELELCVKNQDFEKAITLRDKIKNLK